MLYAVKKTKIKTDNQPPPKETNNNNKTGVCISDTDQ